MNIAIYRFAATLLVLWVPACAQQKLGRTADQCSVILNERVRYKEVDSIARLSAKEAGLKYKGNDSSALVINSALGAKLVVTSPFGENASIVVLYGKEDPKLLIFYRQLLSRIESKKFEVVNCGSIPGLRTPVIYE